jgi:hypothetical protein
MEPLVQDSSHAITQGLVAPDANDRNKMELGVEAGETVCVLKTRVKDVPQLARKGGGCQCPRFPPLRLIPCLRQREWKIEQPRRRVRFELAVMPF